MANILRGFGLSLRQGTGGFSYAEWDEKIISRPKKKSAMSATSTNQELELVPRVDWQKSKSTTQHTENTDKVDLVDVDKDIIQFLDL